MSILDTGRLLLLWAVAVGGSHLLLHLRAYARSDILSSGQTDVLAAVDFSLFCFVSTMALSPVAPSLIGSLLLLLLLLLSVV